MEKTCSGADFTVLGKRYFSRKALSIALNIAEATLAGYAVRKIGPPFIKMGKRVLYPEQGADKWVNDKES